MKKSTIYGLLLVAAALIALVPGCKSSGSAPAAAGCGCGK